MAYEMVEHNHLHMPLYFQGHLLNITNILF